jgi:hypothetical protein
MRRSPSSPDCTRMALVDASFDTAHRQRRQNDSSMSSRRRPPGARRAQRQRSRRSRRRRQSSLQRRCSTMQQSLQPWHPAPRTVCLTTWWRSCCSAKGARQPGRPAIPLPLQRLQFTGTCQYHPLQQELQLQDGVRVVPWCYMHSTTSAGALRRDAAAAGPAAAGPPADGSQQRSRGRKRTLQRQKQRERRVGNVTVRVLDVSESLPPSGTLVARALSERVVVPAVQLVVPDDSGFFWRQCN